MGRKKKLEVKDDDVDVKPNVLTVKAKKADKKAAQEIEAIKKIGEPGDKKSVMAKAADAVAGIKAKLAALRPSVAPTAPINVSAKKAVASVTISSAGVAPAASPSALSSSGATASPQSSRPIGGANRRLTGTGSSLEAENERKRRRRGGQGGGYHYDSGALGAGSQFSY
jgi:hypothetical protein